MSQKKAVPKGLHTKRNAWDDAAEIEVWRGGEKTDPGVNFFVLMLNQMGLPTYFSCEGHPDGFYVTFGAHYREALGIKDVGYFSIEIEQREYWSMRQNFRHKDALREKVDGMRWAAKAWEDRFGALDLRQAELDL